MALSRCGTTTDIHQKEQLKHGDIFFPIACYEDDLSVDKVPWHWHEEWEFAIALEESSTFLLENIQIRLEPGEGIFINGGTLHSVDTPRGCRGKLHSAVFHPRLIGGSVESLFWQNLVQPLMQEGALNYIHLKKEIPWQKKMLDILHHAWYVVAKEPEDFENLLRYELSRAVRLLLQNVKQNHTAPSEQVRRDASRIRMMLKFIEDHYTEDLTLEQVAYCAAVSESVCLRCFKSILATTPIQYVKQLRLEKAAERLKAGERSIRDVALDCGFNDVSYFSKAFRERFGMAPKEYAKNYRK